MGNAPCAELCSSDCTYSGKDHEFDACGVSGDFWKEKNPKFIVILATWIIFFCSAIMSIGLTNFLLWWQYYPGAGLRDPQESHTEYPLAGETVGSTETLQCQVLGTVLWSREHFVCVSETLVPSACDSLVTSRGHRDQAEDEASAITLLAPNRGCYLYSSATPHMATERYFQDAWINNTQA